MDFTPDPPLGRSGERGPVPDEPTTGLLSRLLSDSTALARNEIALAKAEFHNSLADFKMGLTSLAIAGGVLLAGFLALIAAAVIALATMMTWWLAALVAGVALTVLGLLLIHGTKSKFISTGEQMERTQNSLHKDATVVARRT